MQWTADSQLESVRYERKYIVEEPDLGRVIDLLAFHGFFEEFAPRDIQNIYFDSINYKSYHDHTAGVAYRYKTRLRWYRQNGIDNLLPALEIKVRDGDIGYKHRFYLTHFDKNEQLDTNYVRGLLPDEVARNALSGLDPRVFISYKRFYFRHSLASEMRLTLDCQIAAQPFHNPRVLHAVPLSDQIICEMKFPPDSDLMDWNSKKGIGALVQSIQLVPTRYSKYVHAVSEVLLEGSRNPF